MKKLLMLIVCVACVFCGCGRYYVMDRPDMHLAPSVEQLPEKITAVVYSVNPILDLSEGGDGRFAWTSVLWDNKSGKETKLLALNLGSFTGNKRFLIIIPKPLSEVIGSRLAVVDHGGKRIYNHIGDFRLLDSPSKKAKIADFKEFLPEIISGCSFAKELEKKSEEFEDIIKLYSDFRVRDLRLVQKYVYERYGSNLSEDQLDQLAMDDSIIHGFVDWLGRDWKLFLMYPFMDIGDSALIAGVAKVFTLPSIWGDRIDRPGYMEYKPDAEFASKMILRAMEEYSAKQTVGGGSSLPAAVKAAIKGAPCENSSTYEEYNKCAAEYNAAIK